MKEVLTEAGLISNLVGSDKLTQKINQAEKTMKLTTALVDKAAPVAKSLAKGDVLGAGMTLLGLNPPSGLQFTFKAIGLPPQTFAVLSFDYSERYSELYHLSLHLTSSVSALEASQVLDQRGEFTLWQDGKALRTITGMVSSFAQGDTGFAQTHYFIELRPDVWRMTLRRNARIFQQKNLQAILTALLSEHGISHYAFAFTQPHPVREFCVQWQESDFDFLQRLTAEEGIFYYFEQQEGVHTLVFSDDAQTLTQPLPFPYNLNRNAQLQEHSVHQFLQRHQVRHSSAVLKDYTFKKPDWQAQFSQSSESEAQRQGYEHFDYPGRFKDTAQGKAFTQYRLDSLRQDAEQGEGESNIPQLAVGSLLVLSQHPHPPYNTSWQLIEVLSHGEQPQAAEGQAGEKGTFFTNRFKVIPRHQTWRPMQRTKPKVDGPQIARVVGPKGEEIFTDNYGRIRVQFLWDRESQGDDHSSCWIRVSQPWAGQGWGVLAIPRVGQEVLVDFLDGDPDQPIITGRTYHATQLPPGNLPQSKTQMAFRSKTYKGQGYNELLFEDSPGKEQLNLHAQRDMNTQVLNDRTTTVGGNHLETISKDQRIHIDMERYEEISANRTETLKQKESDVGGGYQLLVDKDIHFHSDKMLLLKAQGAHIKMSPDLIEIKGKENVKINAEVIQVNEHNAMPSENVEPENNPHNHIIENKSEDPLGGYSIRVDAYDIYGIENRNKTIPYIAFNNNETLVNGFLDEMGRTQRIYSEKEEAIWVMIGKAKIRLEG